MTTTTTTIRWTGQTGRKYTYYIYPIGTEFKPEPGNYIFARESSLGEFTPVYIGETGDLSERFDNHHKMPCIRRAWATHIHVHINRDGVQARRSEEADLVDRWDPSCNG